MTMNLIILSLVFKERKQKESQIKVFAILSLMKISKIIKRKKLKMNLKKKKINIGKKYEKWKDKEVM